MRRRPLRLDTWRSTQALLHRGGDGSQQAPSGLVQALDQFDE
jgi:hypothetical protein